MASDSRPAPSERTTNTADASTSTIDGKSDIAVSPSACGQELLAEALLIAVDEQRDRRKWSDHPEERRPVAEEATADPARDVVHAQERDRTEHENLEQDERRERLDVRRPRDPRDRREHERPQVAELRRRELELTEQPSLRGEPDLVAALEPHPAVVRDASCEHERRDDLQSDERPDDDAGPLEQAVDGPAGAVGGRGSRASDRHPRLPSGTR